MILQMAVLLAQAFSYPYQNLITAPKNTDSPLESILEELREEIYRVPSRKEYFYFLDGAMNATGYFTHTYGMDYQERYDQLEKDFEAYKQHSDLFHSKVLDMDIAVLLAMDPPKELNFKDSMVQALDHFSQTLQKDISQMDLEARLYLVGEELVLYYLSSHVSDDFDSAFESFDDMFDEYVIEPTPERQQKLLEELNKVQSLVA